MNEVAGRIRRVVCDVVAEAVRASGAPGVRVLEDRTAEGELLHAWLTGRLGEERVWRGGALASNVQGTAAADSALLAHPASRTALLLGGRPPHADLFPFGDVPAARLLDLAGGVSAAPEVEALAQAAGLDALDEALRRLLEERDEPEYAVRDMDPAPGAELLRLYERGRFFRRYPRLVPKLGGRTPGIDLFD